MAQALTVQDRWSGQEASDDGFAAAANGPLPVPLPVSAFNSRWPVARRDARMVEVTRFETPFLPQLQNFFERSSIEIFEIFIFNVYDCADSFLWKELESGF